MRIDAAAVSNKYGNSNQLSTHVHKWNQNIVTHGLTKRPELNGMTGKIDKWSCKLGQYLVDMDENGSKVALKAECLSILVRE